MTTSSKTNNNNEQIIKQVTKDLEFLNIVNCIDLVFDERIRLINHHPVYREDKEIVKELLRTKDLLISEISELK